jgi:hypothetical protein
VGVDNAWLNALADCARKGRLSPPQRERLREVAREALCSPGWSSGIAPLLALYHVGAPHDLVDHLWSIATSHASSDPRERWQMSYAIHWASEVLVQMKDAPALDARIVEAGAEARSSGDYEKLVRLVSIGCRRRLPGALELATRCIDALDEEPALLDAAIQCGYALLHAERIDEEWLLDLLTKPESLRFGIVTCIVRHRPSPPGLAALERALSSTARGGAAAAAAAEALAAINALATDDPRLDGILARAPERERSSLAGALVRLGAPLSNLRGHVMGLLTGANEEAAREMLEDLFIKEPEGITELLESALAQSPTPRIRAELERFLEKPSEAELYFQDTWEEDEDDGDDDDTDWSSGGGLD